MCVLLAFSVSVEQSKNTQLLNIFTQGTCEFFVPKNKNLTLPSCASVTSSGLNYFVKVDLSLAGYVQNQLNNIQAITVVGQGDFEQVLNQLKARVITKEIVQDKQHVFAYSPYFNAFIVKQNKKCNVHMVVEQNQIFVGVPALVGSY